jgi:hypothetical protein
VTAVTGVKGGKQALGFRVVGAESDDGDPRGLQTPVPKSEGSGHLHPGLDRSRDFHQLARGWDRGLPPIRHEAGEWMGHPATARLVPGVERGAGTTAALLFYAHELPAYRKAVAIVSGGNVDPRFLAEAVTESSVLLNRPRFGECQYQFGVGSQQDAPFCTRDARAASRSTHGIQFQLGEPDHRAGMEHKGLASLA